MIAVREDGSPTASGLLGVLDLARGVLVDLDLDVVLERVLEAARDLTGARYAAVSIVTWRLLGVPAWHALTMRGVEWALVRQGIRGIALLLRQNRRSD